MCFAYALAIARLPYVRQASIRSMGRICAQLRTFSTTIAALKEKNEVPICFAKACVLQVMLFGG